MWNTLWTLWQRGRLAKWTLAKYSQLVCVYTSTCLVHPLLPWPGQADDPTLCWQGVLRLSYGPVCKRKVTAMVAKGAGTGRATMPTALWPVCTRPSCERVVILGPLTCCVGACALPTPAAGYVKIQLYVPFFWRPGDSHADPVLRAVRCRASPRPDTPPRVPCLPVRRPISTNRAAKLTSHDASMRAVQDAQSSSSRRSPSTIRTCTR